jgi:hypothetical protein
VGESLKNKVETEHKKKSQAGCFADNEKDSDDERRRAKEQHKNQMAFRIVDHELNKTKEKDNQRLRDIEKDKGRERE